MLTSLYRHLGPALHASRYLPLILMIIAIFPPGHQISRELAESGSLPLLMALGYGIAISGWWYCDGHKP